MFDAAQGHRDLYGKAADGTGAEELLLTDEFDKNPMGRSPDGQLMVAAVSAGRQRFAVGEVKPLVALPRVARRFRNVSPDGR